MSAALLFAGQGAERPRMGLAMAERFERAAELAGGDPVISEHLGDVHLLRGDKERALAFYREAVELEPRPDEQPDLFDKLEALSAELGSP